MGKKLSYRVYRLIRALVWLFYPKTELTGAPLPEGPCVVVGNHAQMHGPIVCTLYFPGEHRIWCAGEMMHLKEVPAYAYRDFWSRKPKSVRWLFRIVSYLIAPLAVCVFNNADCIGVYRDMRVVNTLKNTVRALEQGMRVIILPEKDEPYNGILYRFQEAFVDVGRMVYQRTGQKLLFVPMYIAPALKRAVLGEAVQYDPDAPQTAERDRVCGLLMERITEMARALPPHTVVPYPNLPKRLYPTNRNNEEQA